MISYEDLHPKKIENGSYIKLELRRNDPNELVPKDRDGNPIAEYQLYFQNMILDIVDDMMLSDEERLKEYFVDKKHPDFASEEPTKLTDALKAERNSVLLQKCMKQVGIKFHYNTTCPQIKHV